MALPPYVEFRKLLLEGKVSCRERVTACLETIQSKNDINAFLSIYRAEALAKADAIDQKIKNGKTGQLVGLIVGLKDVIAYKDHPLQAGSKILDGYHANYQSTVVRKLLAEDAIIIGRQNCDEFGMGSSNENSAFGVTLNPHDLKRVPGGSSGGSAAAVAANMCDVSIGSDTGGSVRQPASFCGVYGLKPTYSRISRYGLVAYASSFDCVGIIGQHVQDIALTLQVISGSDDYDSTVSTRSVPNYFTELDHTVSPSRIAVPRLDNDKSIQPCIKEAIQQSTEKLQSLGHSIETIDFPFAEYVLPTYYILATAEASSNLSRYDGVRYGHRSPTVSDVESLYKNSRSEGFGKEVKRRILLGTFVMSASYYDAYYRQAQKVRRRIRDFFHHTFKHYDLVVQPTAPTTAFPLGAHNNDPISMYLADLFSVTANVAGIPAISVPQGEDRDGLPIGIQLMANDFNESTLLRFSRILQRD